MRPGWELQPFVGKGQEQTNVRRWRAPRGHEGCCYWYHSELRSRNQRAGYWGSDKGGQGLCSWISSGCRRGSQSRSPEFIKEEFNTAEQISQQLADPTWTIASYAGLLSLLVLWVNNKVNLVRVTGSEQGQFRSICPWRVWFLLLQISWSEPELMAPSLVHLLDKWRLRFDPWHTSEKHDLVMCVFNLKAGEADPGGSLGLPGQLANTNS